MSEHDLIHNIYLQAKALGACDLITGDETLSEILELFLSPQGSEFCMKHRFPSTRVMRSFKPFDLERHGIYIDAGDITLYDPVRVAIIGRTSAKIYCSQTILHRIFLYRGASAVIQAGGWSVTRVRAERGCKTIQVITDNAIIT